MRKNTVLLALAVILSACSKDSVAPESISNQLSFTAEISTKTALDADGARIIWKDSDKIGIFSNGSIYEFTTTESGSSVTFTGNAPISPSYYAIYPYNAEASINNDVITTELPSVQSAVKDGLADGANLTIAYTEDNILSFKNVGGLVRFTLTRDDIKSVKLIVNENESIAGKIDISMASTPSFTVNQGSKEVEINTTDEALAPGCYNMVVLPGTFHGFSLVFTDKNGKSETKSSPKDLTVNRSETTNLQTVDSDIFAPKAYCVDLNSIDWTDSFIYDVKDNDGKKVAVICKEFLGKDANMQAITVYGTKNGAMNSGNPQALVARVLKTAAESGKYENYNDVEATSTVHGGTASFLSNETSYTAGSKQAISTVYISIDNEISTVSDTEIENAVSLNAEARTLTLSDRGDEKAYKLVKINRLIWTAENLITAKYNDGTDIEKKTATDLQNATGAAHVQVNSGSYAYNGNAVQSGKLGTADGWGVPSKTDSENMYKFCGSISHTLNSASNNVSGFSNKQAGRVTTKWEKTLDPCFWCSNAISNNKMNCLVVRTAGTAPTVTTQAHKYGFWIRLKHILY